MSISTTRPGAPPPGTSPADVERRVRLRRMKLIAAGLLLLMAVIFVIAHLLEPQHPWAGYVRAAAEAGMVGALADWFAVTALFRHPLRLPIPHTAIIPKRKDAIGSALSEFVATNFLSEEVVREKLARFSLASRVGGFLADTGAERITAELAGLARGVTTVLRDDQIAALLESMALRRLDEVKVGPLIGRIGADVVAKGDHHRLVDVVIEKAHQWIDDNPAVIIGVVTERAPVWTPKFLDDKLAERVYREVESFARAVRYDPEHPLRAAVDRFLAQFAQDLQTDPDTIAKAERIKERILANASVRSLAGSAWESVKKAVLAAAEDPESDLRVSLTQALRSLGRRMQTDPDLAAKIDNWVADAAGYLARHHARSITGIIDETIARWDGEATSQRIELQVGRDLQFIRINGTVVGALAGLVIYTLAQWLL
ncbi:DUF445 family protein [Nakamurella sp. YIM 132087]|uniref:DUF445 family protein n=1 Tax=Nakamurella alba TaxID=2665158 RepID=A0A7K1FMK3_9ACTN|nr:DUF445 family protein [Nakamurella alba]MTD14549.1 DUF445 family protein [Nakamurella alba]